MDDGVDLLEFKKKSIDTTVVNSGLPLFVVKIYGLIFKMLWYIQ